MAQMTLPSGLVSAFVTLLATNGLIETAAIFIVVTHAVQKSERKRFAARSTVIASIMLVAFALIGGPVLDYLHVSMPAFRIAGSLLQFLQADADLPSPGLASIEDCKRRDAEAPRDIAIFTLAFPAIAGPRPHVSWDGRPTLGTRGSVLAMLESSLQRGVDAHGDIYQAGARDHGRTEADLVGRIPGALLAGLAVHVDGSAPTRSVPISAAPTPVLPRPTATLSLDTRPSMAPRPGTLVIPTPGSPRVLGGSDDLL